jgi:methylthioribose-1-phosphate isomerase
LTDYASVQWTRDIVRVLDQRVLPHQVVYRDLTDEDEVAAAIREMVVRGAPLIGAVAAYGMALAARRSTATDPIALRADLARVAELLAAARPTAVNLTWAVARVIDRVEAEGLASVEEMKRVALDEAHRIALEDVQVNRQLGWNALPLIPDVATIIHHCNTGGLATVDVGTALGVIRVAHEQGKRIHVLVDETRPRLQGARLTAWELRELGIPYTVIVDGASGHFMRTKGIDLCLVGCDRVAANGDTANKIGTYNLALVARAHGVPFYVAAPTSTIDLTVPHGDAIPIEERSPREVTHVGEEWITPDGASVANPAFDITPAAYITAIITEAGIAWPPYESSLAALVEQARAHVRR